MGASDALRNAVEERDLDLLELRRLRHLEHFFDLGSKEGIRTEQKYEVMPK